MLSLYGMSRRQQDFSKVNCFRYVSCILWSEDVVLDLLTPLTQVVVCNYRNKRQIYNRNLLVSRLVSHFASCKIDQNNRSVCARTIGVLDLNAIAALSITISHDLMIFTNTCMSQILYTIKILEPNVWGHVSVLRGLFADCGITAR